MKNNNSQPPNHTNTNSPTNLEDALREILAEVYQRGWKCAQAGYVSEDDKKHAVREALAQIIKVGEL